MNTVLEKEFVLGNGIVSGVLNPKSSDHIAKKYIKVAHLTFSSEGGQNNHISLVYLPSQKKKCLHVSTQSSSDCTGSIQ